MNRDAYLRRIIERFSIHPVVALLGLRQCGKTTLARMFAEAIEAVAGGVAGQPR